MVLDNHRQVKELRVDDDRLFSAGQDEIKAGLTADIYFVKTKEILQSSGKADAEVVAEIFPASDGVLAGVPEVVNLLKDLDVCLWSRTEGETFSPRDVIMQVKGRYVDFGIFETAMLGILAHSSGWASASHRCRQAAGDSPFLCFGARHVHPAVAPVMERAAVVGGADGASCILGAKLAGLQPSGTVPHALFLIMGDTLTGARAYHRLMPADEARVILVDTFKDEVEETLRLASELGDSLAGIRLDTPSERGGVTPDLVREVRTHLDRTGHNHVKIFVSGGLTPERITVLKQAGAHAFGVGSYISSAAPIDMTMDVKEVDGKPVSKRGRLPGAVDARNAGLRRLL